MTKAHPKMTVPDLIPDAAASLEPGFPSWAGEKTFSCNSPNTRNESNPHLIV